MAEPRTGYQEAEQYNNPLDFIESCFGEEDWECERISSEQLSVVYEANKITLYGIFFWDEKESTLYFQCPLKVSVPDRLPGRFYELLYRINEPLSFGRVVISGEVIVYEYALILDGAEFSGGQLQQMLQCALDQAKNLPPVFQALLFGGKSPLEAIQYGCLEPVGEA